MRTLFVTTLAILALALGVNIAHASYVPGVGGPSGLPRLQVIEDRSAKVGWPHKPSIREMRAVVRAVLREHTAGAGPRIRGGVNCNFGRRMGSFVYCTIVVQYNDRFGRRTKTYFARYKFYEDGSSRVEYDGA